MKITPVKLWRRQDETTAQIGKRGSILLWSIIRIPSKTFMSQAPYPIVIVELPSKERMVGQLVDWDKEDLRKGRKVVAVLRKNVTDEKEGIIPYVIKFRPV